MERVYENKARRHLKTISDRLVSPNDVWCAYGVCKSGATVITELGNGTAGSAGR